MTLHAKAPPLPTIPSDAVATRRDWNVVAVVEPPENRLHLQPVETGLNDGVTAQVRRGLEGCEAVVVSLPIAARPRGWWCSPSSACRAWGPPAGARRPR